MTNNMTNNLKLNIFRSLIKADLIVFGKSFFGKFINLGIWVSCTILIFGYIMQSFGMKADFGVFQFAGAIATVGLFEMYGNIVRTVLDFESGDTIKYQFALPISSKLVFIRIIFTLWLEYLLCTIAVLPFGKLLLWNMFDLSNVNYFYLIVIMALSSLFFSIFTIWGSTMIRGMHEIENVWSRFIFPLWFFSGFQFSWIAFYKTFKILALINLLNPLVYIMEGSRVAILGQQDYLPFYLCVVALLIYIVIISISAFFKLKRRLDFV